MTQIKRKLLTAETRSHGTHEVRITFADQVQLDKTSRAQGWRNEKDWATQPTPNAFLFWNAARREGALPESLTFEQFVDEELIDFEFRTEDAGTHGGEGTDVDPT